MGGHIANGKLPCVVLPHVPEGSPQVGVHILLVVLQEQGFDFPLLFPALRRQGLGLPDALHGLFHRLLQLLVVDGL